jgi:hypothetical protein
VAAPFRGPLGLDDELGRKRRRSDGSHLAGVDEVTEGGKCLVHIGGGIGTVHLVEVDVIGAEPAETVLGRLGDPPAGAPAPVGVVPHRQAELGGQDDLVSAPLDGLAHDGLGLTRRVHVGRVDEVDAGVEGGLDHPDRFVVIRIAARSEHHGPEGHLADRDAGGTENPAFHPAALR